VRPCAHMLQQPGWLNQGLGMNGLMWIEAQVSHYLL
jgi:hypothetical protein